jgi:hypothetical protein
MNDSVPVGCLGCIILRREQCTLYMLVIGNICKQPTLHQLLLSDDSVISSSCVMAILHNIGTVLLHGPNHSCVIQQCLLCGPCEIQQQFVT